MIHPNLHTVAIDPTRKGFGFVVLEGRQRLLEWGVARAGAPRGKDLHARVEPLLERYQPCVVVAEEISVSDGRRRRARRQVSAVSQLAASMHLPFATVSRKQVREMFRRSGVTKYEIALALVASFPELDVCMPRKRKPWTNEDDRMNVFDALSFAVTALDDPESSFPVL